MKSVCLSMCSDSAMAFRRKKQSPLLLHLAHFCSCKLCPLIVEALVSSSALKCGLSSAQEYVKKDVPHDHVIVLKMLLTLVTRLVRYVDSKGAGLFQPTRPLRYGDVRPPVQHCWGKRGDAQAQVGSTAGRRRRQQATAVGVGK